MSDTLIQAQPKNAGFGKAWWENFLRMTKNQSQTSVIEKAFSSQTASEYNLAVLDILRTLSKLRTDQYGYRVYIEGVKLREKERDLSMIIRLCLMKI
jgi:hypothetical protein